MSPKIKNIIIIAAVVVLLILLYIFFFKKAPGTGQNLVATPPAMGTSFGSAPASGNPIAQNFLSLLLSVRNIKLRDNIFSDRAFLHLRDSSIVLPAPSLGDEGRPNPFAPIGFENIVKTPAKQN